MIMSGGKKADCRFRNADDRHICVFGRNRQQRHDGADSLPQRADGDNGSAGVCLCRGDDGNLRHGHDSSALVRIGRQTDDPYDRDNNGIVV